MSPERLTTADLARADRAAIPAPEAPTAPATVDARPAPTEQLRDEGAPLFAPDIAGDFRRRWDDIQTGFVDEPRRAVEQADTLVAEAMKRLAETFADERGKLEGHWDRGDQVSTEDLRQVLRRYRSFFHRLLSV